MRSFADQVILITGAGSGIGRQLARTLAAEGAAIAALDVQTEPLAALAAELPGRRVVWAVGDVTDLAGLRKATKELQDQLGPVDVLIANAGIGRETSALDFHAEDTEAHLRVNLIGVANSIDAVLPGMLTRRSGHLVAISSLASFRGLPRMAGYCASKAGLNALLDSLRFELQPLGISVTTICPGWIRTPLTANVQMPMPNLLDVEAAVRLMVEAIRARRSFYAFPGSSARQLRLLRWLPADWSDWLLARTVRGMARETRS